MDELRAKLNKQILSSATQQSVKLVIDEALEHLNKYKIPANTFFGFIRKMIADLDLYDPMSKTRTQWTNIKIARMHFLQIQWELKIETGINNNKEQ